ncbi:hypothetical protein H072_8563 [Dactylellina haptotyla CBS 200.50]|uniref:BLOC-1-related complex subunit 5 n=1 Tax=Dactylellina haptotyla (strain CBS 200.50) TaxID=1284197 RepID=S8A4G6_DACHA|nr:hypothetical protein H072_8563 [Dactylellina haptotyla CBS 200.50]
MSTGPSRKNDLPSDEHGSHRRRHSLPPANKLASILSFWSNNSQDSLRLTGERLSRPRSQASAKPGRRNRRNSKSKLNSAKPVVTQPVLVRAYSPRPESTVAATIPELDESERVELPSIDAFSFSSILKAIDPKVTRTLSTISHLSTTYRSNLTHETEILITYQKSIESQIVAADNLSTQVLKTTTTRSDRLKSDNIFKNAGGVEELAQSAESAYSAIENIIATLEAIDEMLPPEERLGTQDSAHKRHYPYTHSLLVAKNGNSTKRMSQLQTVSGEPISSPLSPRMTNSNSFSSNHNLMGDTATTGSGGGSWLFRRRQQAGGLPSNLPYLSPNGPPISAEERRLSSPPALLLRTVHPPSSAHSAREFAGAQVSSPSPYHIRRQSLVTNIPVRERDSMSVASNAGQSTRSSFSFKNLLWGGGWRKGSNASAGSASVAGSEAGGETAEEKLRRIIQEQTRKRLQLDKKGAGLSSSLPM